MQTPKKKLKCKEFYTENLLRGYDRCAFPGGAFLGEEIHLKSIEKRIRAVELLRLLKKTHTYDELSRVTGLPITVLNRYVKGHILPKVARAEELLGSFSNERELQREISKRIKFDSRGYFDNTALLSDTLLLRFIARMTAQKFSKDSISTVLTAAVDGIPIATHVANELGVNIIIAKKSREVGISDFLEESYIPSFSGVMMSLYIPKGMIDPKDNILIVDDVIRSGETQRALVNMVRKAGAKVVRIFVLVSVGSSWKKKELLLPHYPVEVLVQVREP